ncbi:MAG: HNH endonuclease [Thiomonas sp.]
MKTCSKCRNQKPTDEFHRDAQKKDGLRSECKECFRNKPQCLIEGCDRAAASAGMCSMHYQRQIKNGTTDAMQRATMPIKERLLKKVDIDPSGGCWNWTGATNESGYGQVFDTDAGRVVLAHRASYEAFVGAIPALDGYHGACVCHRCDNPRCINPDHLFIGTHRNNMSDMAEKGRHRNSLKNPAYSHEDHPRAKLNPDVVKTLRSRRHSAEEIAQLATQLGVSRTALRYAASSKTWRKI